VGFVAEEEGLVGASLHSAKAEREGWVIDAVFNNDIVGNTEGGTGIIDGRTVRVFSEDPMDSPSRQLARFIRRHSTAEGSRESASLNPGKTIVVSMSRKTH